MRARTVTSLVVAVLCAAPAVADDSGFSLRKVERLFLDGVLAGRDGERATELYVRSETSIGEPVDDLRPVDIVVIDNGERIDGDDIELLRLGESKRGLSCVLAIDVSASLQGNTFEQARAGALDFLDALGGFDRVAIVAFADAITQVSDFDDPRAAARSSLEQLQVERSGGAERNKLLFDALNQGLAQLRKRTDLPRRSVVLVFADGDDVGSSSTADEVAELARGDDFGTRTPIFGIGYGRSGFDALRQLSEETHAYFFQASSSTYLPDFFDRVRRQMLQSYVVRYPASMDGEAHEIEVRIEQQQASRTARYPEISRSVWPWLVAVAAIAGVGGVGSVAARSWMSGGSLLFENGARRGERVAVRGRTLRIGALADNDIVIESPAVSRYHARIYRRGSELLIEDCDSSNGTAVNGQPVGSAALQPGDRIRIADVDLVYER